MRLYYVRHGDPIYSPDSLTPLGHAQAEALSKWFLRRPLDRVYASSSNRAVQTSLPTCRLQGKEPILCDWAHEMHAFEDFHALDAEGKKQWILEVPSTIRTAPLTVPPLMCTDEVTVSPTAPGHPNNSTKVVPVPSSLPPPILSIIISFAPLVVIATIVS